MCDAAESFNVLRLVLCTQPRSNPIAFEGGIKLCTIVGKLFSLPGSMLALI
jgi:hypothetical protein